MIVGSFIVSRIDKRGAELKMNAADLKMDIFRNETKLDMERMRNETKAEMDRMSTESRIYNILTLLVAVLAVVVPIGLKSV